MHDMEMYRVSFWRGYGVRQDRIGPRSSYHLCRIVYRCVCMSNLSFDLPRGIISSLRRVCAASAHSHFPFLLAPRSCCFNGEEKKSEFRILTLREGPFGNRPRGMSRQVRKYVLQYVNTYRKGDGRFPPDVSVGASNASLSYFGKIAKIPSPRPADFFIHKSIFLSFFVDDFFGYIFSTSFFAYHF